MCVGVLESHDRKFIDSVVSYLGDRINAFKIQFKGVKWSDVGV